MGGESLKLSTLLPYAMLGLLLCCDPVSGSEAISERRGAEVNHDSETDWGFGDGTVMIVCVHR